MEKHERPWWQDVPASYGIEPDGPGLCEHGLYDDGECTDCKENVKASIEMGLED